MFFVHTNNVQTTENVYKSDIYAAADVAMLFIYKTSTFFTFRIFAPITTPSSILFHNFVKVQDQSFYTQKDLQLNLYDGFI